MQGPTSGQVSWMRSLGSTVTSGPVVGSDGSIVVATNAGVLYALDPVTGSVRWKFDGGGALGTSDLSTSAAVLSGGTVVWPGPGSKLFALDSSGKQLWSIGFAATLLSPVIASPSKVYVEDVDGNLSAVQVTPTSGKVLWTVALGGSAGSSFGSPAIGTNGTIYTTVGHDAVAIVDAGDHGQVLWRYSVSAAIEVSPAVGPDGTVVVGTNDRYQYGLSPKGQLLWKVQRQRETYSSTAVTADGLAYYGDNAGNVYVTNATKGVPVVRYSGMGGQIWSTPVIDSGHDAYFGTQLGHIFGYRYDGTRLFDINAHGPIDSYPALTADGTLIVGTEKGSIYAIKR